MIEINGAEGEGGGQILRTALSLSLVSGKPFRIINIRGNRSKPGLMRQHLTAVNAAVRIGNAKATGAIIGSTELTFEPVDLVAADYEFAVGTAGSTTLVLQTILPALLCAKKKSTVRIRGGTHNPHAPPFDFLEKAFLPLLRKMGWNLSCSLERPGFYPAGGGCISAKITPTKSQNSITLNFRGNTERVWAKAAVSCLPEHIAKRELQVIRDKLDLDRSFLRVDRLTDDCGPGNIVTIGIESDHLTEIFCGFGEKGQKAEEVADRVAIQALEYLESTTPVGRYLADQLLLPMALVGSGEFETLEPTAHFYTNADIIKQFLNVDIETTPLEGQRYRIRVSS